MNLITNYVSAEEITCINNAEITDKIVLSSRSERPQSRCAVSEAGGNTPCGHARAIKLPCPTNHPGGAALSSAPRRN